MAGHQRTADTPAGGGRADGRTHRRAADRGALHYGWACTHAHAMGEGRTRREPRRGGREDAPTRRCGYRNMYKISQAPRGPTFI
jgi:hypothetical protein